MIDQIRRDIQQRLDQLLGEVDKLRRALAALGSQDGARSSATSARGKAAATSSRSRTGTGASTRTQAGSTRARRSSSASATRARTGKPGTKSAVLAALASGNAMTAGEVASATGLGRASVSTTLSKLAKSGEVTKAERGYRLPEAAK